ncbi:cytochrome P450 [Amycolatopsis suaedae]|uniref:Cytochrome P450 n=1 Tax=Amycolatopsis suaedae TaxID=2510978 RepID=A0A4Q7J8Z0_9PSEU|nr:cytochrome P450 [Amycolatopsis suaedae]RZQ62594.1 cytochrome P450 [Amycolatopsis suaedae]
MTETTTPVFDGLPIERERPLDPPDAITQVREDQPVARLRFPDGHLGWLVTGYAETRQIMGDPRFSSNGHLKRPAIPTPRFKEGMTRELPPGMFLHMDPPDHTRLRKQLTGQFTVRRMKQLAPRIEQIANDHAQAMLRNGPPADLVRDFALPIPSLVICELLGVPYADRERFQRDSARMLKLDTGAEEAAASIASVYGFLAELVQRKKSEPADDLLSGLIEAGVLDDGELAGVGFLLLIAGHETTANMLSLGTYTLLRNPEQLAKLRADESLMDGAVEELLRYLTIVHLGTQRIPTEDVEIGGVRIKAGEVTVLHLQGANRDPERFGTADELRVDRGASGHLAFGHGIHQCLGQQLARIEMRIGYTTLLRTFPDLRLAVPAEEVKLRTDMAIYGAHELPVTW